MLYTDLCVKGKYSKIWIAAHWNKNKKINKSDIGRTNIAISAQELMNETSPLTLRIIAQLLLGISRIYSRQVEYLYFDWASVLTLVQSHSNNFPTPHRRKTLHVDDDSLSFRGTISGKSRKTKKEKNNSEDLKKIFSIAKELKRQKSSDDEEIILRSSQQKLGRAEDINLPEKHFHSGEENFENQQFDHTGHLEEHGEFFDFGVDHELSPFNNINSPNTTESSIEVQRNAMIDVTLPDGLSFNENSLASVKLVGENGIVGETTSSPLKKLNFDQLLQFEDDIVMTGGKRKQTPNSQTRGKKFLRIDEVTKLSADIKNNVQKNQEEVMREAFKKEALEVILKKPLLLKGLPNRLNFIFDLERHILDNNTETVIDQNANVVEQKKKTEDLSNLENLENFENFENLGETDVFDNFENLDNNCLFDGFGNEEMNSIESCKKNNQENKKSTSDNEVLNSAELENEKEKKKQRISGRQMF